MVERWSGIPGYLCEYAVSDQGRVKSLDRMVRCSGPVRGTYWSLRKGQSLRPGRKPSGHMSVCLGRSSGAVSVHALVLLAFKNPYPPHPGSEIRHLNGDPSDNRLVNLEYANRSRNGQDKKWHAGQKGYKLNPEEVKDILLRLCNGRLRNQLFHP